MTACAQQGQGRAKEENEWRTAENKRRWGGDGVELLVLRRARRQGDPWSGHCCLPGGNVEDGEALAAAAARETLVRALVWGEGHDGVFGCGCP
jgi:ADP-ribose pyrophosphatase YjhB (NUDIX family)